MSVSPREVIEKSVAAVVSRGWTIKPEMVLDLERRECCPLFAVGYEHNMEIPALDAAGQALEVSNSWLISFMQGFDRRVKSKAKDKEAFDLGRELRLKFVPPVHRRSRRGGLRATEESGERRIQSGRPLVS